jgi:hypothetical protein
MIFERRELDQSIDDLLSAVGWNVNTDVGQHQKQEVRMNYIIIISNFLNEVK